MLEAGTTIGNDSVGYFENEEHCGAGRALRCWCRALRCWQSTAVLGEDSIRSEETSFAPLISGIGA